MKKLFFTLVLLLSTFSVNAQISNEEIEYVGITETLDSISDKPVDISVASYIDICNYTNNTLYPSIKKCMNNDLSNIVYRDGLLNLLKQLKDKRDKADEIFYNIHNPKVNLLSTTFLRTYYFKEDGRNVEIQSIINKSNGEIAYSSTDILDWYLFLSRLNLHCEYLLTKALKIEVPDNFNWEGVDKLTIEDFDKEIIRLMDRYKHKIKVNL